MANAPATRRAAGANSSPWQVGFPLAVFAVHWLIVQVAATASRFVGVANSSSPPYGRDPQPMSGLAAWIVEPLRQWDGLWYVLIAQTGYSGGRESAKAAFWPLFPWLMDMGSRLTGWRPETVGYLIANLSFAVALVLLHRLLRLDFSDRIARRTLLAVAFFPTAFFFQAVYTESLFFVLAVAALLAARLGHWWAAGIAGALAALTRSYGVLLGLPFLFLLWDQCGRDWRGWLPRLPFAALPALGPLAFGWHLQQVQGSWRAFIDVQGQWDRYPAMPWETLRCAIESCGFYAEPDGASWDRLAALTSNPALFVDPAWRVDIGNSGILELICTLLFLGLALLGLWLLPPWQSAFAVPGLLIPLFSPSRVHALMSMPRFGLVLFPLFVVLALTLRPSGLGRIALILSAILMALLTFQFAQWYWVS
jgi:hypothetical protein